MTLTKRGLVARYTSFSVIATLSNITTQAATFWFYHGDDGLVISIIAGTAIGFVVKYLLDKRFIFFDKRTSATGELTKVTLYGVTAIVTTIIFWSAEFGFWTLWHTSLAKYAGAVIGLCIGYVVKYLLDRRYVFVEARIL